MLLLRQLPGFVRFNEPLVVELVLVGIRIRKLGNGLVELIGVTQVRRYGEAVARARMCMRERPSARFGEIRQLLRIEQRKLDALGFQDSSKLLLGFASFDLLLQLGNISSNFMVTS